MATEEDKTSEGRLLDQHPDIRSNVFSSADFQNWMASLPTVVVDDVKYYIRGGDMLKDEDQIVLEWARKVGLPSGEEVAQDSAEAAHKEATES